MPALRKFQLFLVCLSALALPFAHAIPGLTKHSLYAVYYGNWSESLIHDITGATGKPKYDLVIVHPKSNLTRADVAQMQAAGVRVVCYLSLGEEGTLRPGASWYYDADRDGRPDRNAHWNSYYTNVADPQWRSALKNFRNVGAQRWYGSDYLWHTLGCDGLFLDTIDTVQPAAWGGPYAAQLSAMIDLIADLRTHAPANRLLIINRGLFYFDPYDAATNPGGLREITPAMRDRLRSLINGVLIESIMQEKHRASWAKKLADLTVFTLDYLPPAHARPVCAATRTAFGWLPYISTPALDTFSHVVRERCGK